MTSKSGQGFVLHARPYRNTSLIVEFFTLEQGRFGAVARGARRPQSPFRGQLQPFIPLWLAYSGRGSLQQCLQAQARGVPYYLDPSAVYPGLYMNELLMKLCPVQEPLAPVYEAYQQSLKMLAENTSADHALRYFERRLLQALGYGLNLTSTAVSEGPIEPMQMYGYEPGTGLLPLMSTSTIHGFLGRDILAYSDEDFTDPAVLTTAKQINRLAIEFLLGDKPLGSRQLAQDLQRCRKRMNYE